MLALLTGFLQPKSLLRKLEQLQQQDKELDKQIDALQPHVDKLKELMGRLSGNQMQGALKPILQSDPSVQQVVTQIELLLRVRDQVGKKQLVQQYRELADLQAQRETLEKRVGALKGAVKVTEEQNQRLQVVVQTAEDNDAELARLAIQAHKIVAELPRYV